MCAVARRAAVVVGCCLCLSPHDCAVAVALVFRVFSVHA